MNCQMLAKSIIGRRKRSKGGGATKLGLGGKSPDRGVLEIILGLDEGYVERRVGTGQPVRGGGGFD